MSAKKAFFLILRNILRIAAVSLVGDFILLLGKVRKELPPAAGLGLDSHQQWLLQVRLASLLCMC